MTPTFTSFLTTQHLREPKVPEPSFLHFVRRDPLWPHGSNRLDHFEVFLLARLDELDAEYAIPELRDLWRQFARETSEGKHDLDLPLAAWGDYARHLRTCSGTALFPCDAAAELLARALAESDFDELPRPLGDLSGCDGMERPATENEENASEDDKEKDADEVDDEHAELF